MSEIRATFNCNEKKWNFQKVSLQPRISTSFKISFFSENEYTEFENLSFGYKILHIEEILIEDSFPKNNEIYLALNRAPVNEFMLTLKTDNNYILSVWCENAGERIPGELAFVIPIPPKPYDDWVWGDQEWIPPIPRPINPEMGAYDWDQETKSWYVITPRNMQPVVPD
jgi:hypothetical protein